jgi:hypothetical protein
MSYLKISEKQRAANERVARKYAARASRMGFKTPVSATDVEHARYVREMGL